MKKVRLLLFVGILILLIVCSAIYLVSNFFGPKANDAFAKEKIDVLESVSMPDGIRIVDTTTFIGKRKNDEQFIVWVGIAIKTSLAKQELELSIKTLPEFEKAEIFPYELVLANELNFTGIQKEVMGTDSKDVYLVGITLKPKTIFDKRNH